MKGKKAVIVVLAVLCLTVTLFSVIPVMSVQPYDPWKDVNDDGVIDAKDYQAVKSRIPSIGTPLDKGYLAYDSGWINITDKQGQYITVTHGLNITDWNSENIDVGIMGKTSPDGELMRSLGLTGLVQGWNKTFGGIGSDRANALVRTTDGGYALAGDTNSYGAGGSDVWLVKTDSLGNHLWNKTIGWANEGETAYALVQTVDGGYALAGLTYSTGAGNADGLLVKTDASGNAQWNKTYGGTNYDFFHGIVQTGDGGYAISGRTTSSGAGSGDVWLVKTDASGNAQWSQTYGGTGDEYGGSLVQTVDGGYALAGYTKSYGAGSNDFYLVKTDASGNMQWNKTYGGTSSDSTNTVIQTTDGGYALVGSTAYYLAGPSDVWLVKTDSLGNHLWNKTYGGINDDGSEGPLIQTLDGGYAIPGFTSSFGAGSYDGWLIKTDASGNMQWNKTYGGTNFDSLRGIVQTGDGGYALAGETISYGAGGVDLWLVKTDSLGNGLVWFGSTPNTIELYRGTDDDYWNYVRVRLWTPK